MGAEIEGAYAHQGAGVRVGVHTGDVLLGGGVDAEGTIRGMAVNISARMEQTAPTGALRVCHDTYARVRGVFEVAAQNPLSVKGVDGPLQTYLVIGAKRRSFRTATRTAGGNAKNGITRSQVRRQAAVTVGNFCPHALRSKSFNASSAASALTELMNSGLTSVPY
ncbi:MAG: adenylate/guanylate cyclase domain-containing protein [Variovorax sp.]|nr:MAG: adenylate/guanylate cyclase domain-containing protein [Variovorax sp.]